jgi:hypothetical protein
LWSGFPGKRDDPHRAGMIPATQAEVPSSDTLRSVAGAYPAGGRLQGFYFRWVENFHRGIDEATLSR